MRPPVDHPHKCEHGQCLYSMEIVLRGILLAAGEFSLDGKSVGLIFRNQLIKLLVHRGQQVSRAVFKKKKVKKIPFSICTGKHWKEHDLSGKEEN